MGMRRTKTKEIILILLLLCLIAPLLQSNFSFIHEAKLEGAFVLKTKPTFNWKDWFSGKYQKNEEEYLNESFGFRNSLVRVNNQLAFSFFGRANAENIVVGKNNYLFQRPSINAYFGLDFLGNERIETRMNRLKFISDTLSKLNKNLILIFGTGKGSFFPEYIPEKFHTEKGITNFEYQPEIAQKLGLNYIDFNRYFIDFKKTSPYPLFPQYGIHWSRYGGCLVTDSVLHYIESLRNIDMPELIIDTIEMSRPENEDYDIAGGMNLLFRLKSFDMAYPKIRYESDSGKTKPSVLVIGDSFYWGMSNMDISKAFSKNTFWFYNNRGTAGALHELSVVMRLKMAEEIKDYDVVILIGTEASMPDWGWGFIENTYCYFKGRSITELDELLFQDEVLYIKERLKKDKRRMERITEMAALKKISVDSMITLRALQRVNKKRNVENK